MSISQHHSAGLIKFLRDRTLGTRLEKPVSPSLFQHHEPTPTLDDLYRPFPRQNEFHTSKAKYRLFGGAAGPGKTKALLWEAIRKANRFSGCDTLLLRRTFPELETSLLAQFRRDVPRDFYRSYNESKHVVTWTNGSTTRFGYCRNENDVYQYQGAEFLFIGIDELTHFTLKQWQFLTSRNRCPVRDSTPCMAGATNPGNIGHTWVKALWIDKVPPPGCEGPEQYDPNDYHFTRAKIEDNPIYARDQSYLKSLGALPDKLRRAFLEGNWDVFAGQYFDIFEMERHTARVEALGIQWWWPRWISIDWGFHHPSAVYWHVAVPDETNHDPRDPRNGRPRIITYREFLKNSLSPRMLGQAIAELSKNERIADVFLSPDAFAHRMSEASIAEQLGDVLEQNGLPRPTQAQDDRVGGWQLMYQLLENDDWIIADNCRELMECLPTLVRDDHKVEDVRKVEGDDAADAARYGLVSGVRYAGFGAHFRAPGAGQAPPDKFSAASARFIPGMPLDVQIEKMITAQDPTSRAIHRQRLQAEAKRQFGPHHLSPKRWKW